MRDVTKPFQMMLDNNIKVGTPARKTEGTSFARCEEKVGSLKQLTRTPYQIES
jgi:hypothetical protein